MASLIGFYALVLGACLSLVIVLISLKNFRNPKNLNEKIIPLTFLQFFLVLVSFFGLIISFINSDFSNETVFNHSHTTKPLFYKISGTWGNHEGSLFLVISFNLIYLFIYFKIS